VAQALSDIVLSNLSTFLAKEMGLQFPRERWPDLERGVRSAAREFGFDDIHDCIRWLMSAPLSRQQIETLAATLTIGETYFFRDPAMLEALESEILPALIRDRGGKERRLRIWSAGCSTGEEAYTVAILLHRLIPDLHRWNITILATDINRASLDKAIAGVYGRWSFRATPSWFNSYFTREEEGRFRISAEIRKMVCFEYLNLAEDSYPSLPTNTNAMDVIFCRNVLMYFSPETARSVVTKLQRSLVNDGWLIVGPADLPAKVAPLKPVAFKGTTCYRKASHQPAPQPATAPPTVAPPVPHPLQEGEPLLQQAGPSVPPPLEGGGQGVGERATKKAPGTAASSYSAADSLYRQGLYAEAAAMLATLRETTSLPTEALSLLVRAYANQGKLPQALAVCDDALRQDKLDPSLYYLKAEILQEQGKLEEAQMALLRSLYLDPQLVMAHFAMGNLALWRGNVERSDKHFRNALALLESRPPDEIVPGSEGMTVGRLREIVDSMSAGARRAGGGRS
jgi:chemotaxis protein methyltransferase CheR